ncbi:MAG: hypothetical protein U1F43_00890 [Myxococcota bacterium]
MQLRAGRQRHVAGHAAHAAQEALGHVDRRVQERRLARPQRARAERHQAPAHERLVLLEARQDRRRRHAVGQRHQLGQEPGRRLLHGEVGPGHRVEARQLDGEARRRRRQQQIDVDGRQPEAVAQRRQRHAHAVGARRRLEFVNLALAAQHALDQRAHRRQPELVGPARLAVGRHVEPEHEAQLAAAHGAVGVLLLVVDQARGVGPHVALDEHDEALEVEVQVTARAVGCVHFDKIPTAWKFSRTLLPQPPTQPE